MEKIRVSPGVNLFPARARSDMEGELQGSALPSLPGPNMSACIRPPLKWAGGKYRLLSRILPVLPQGKRLVEPFVGSGAVFLNAEYPSFLLCDLNEDLITFYKTLTRHKERFIKACAAYFTPEFNNAERFYALRTEFNALAFGPERAALFLYLNRHAFNGLVRYNNSGQFNTPFGRYTRPYFPEKELAAVVWKAKQARLTFAVRDFRSTFALLRPGDVVYCDPPYCALSETANFTSYTAASFGGAEQEELSRCAVRARDAGHTVVISNHSTEFSRGIYRDAHVSTFPVKRTISCDGSNRTDAQELLAVYS